MNISIFNRWTGKVQFECELSVDAADWSIGVKLGFAVKQAYKTGAVLTRADLRGADLTRAVLTRADLRDADLTRAVLTRADLRDADLRDADLTGADLTGADLRDADLTGAVLTRAVLTGADLRDANVPVIAHIDATILAAIEAGGHLKMNNWHTCGTTHCRAGWAITLAGEAGLKLESVIGSSAAGALIYNKSRPNQRIPDFYASDDAALADIRACAAADPLS